MPIKHITVNEDKTKLNRIREYLEVMKDEPEGYIKMSEVYHSLRRMLEDENTD